MFSEKSSRRFSKKVLSAALLLTCIVSQTPVVAQDSGPFDFFTKVSPDGSHFQFTKGDAVKNPPIFRGDSSGNIYAKDDRGNELGTCVLKHTDVSVKVTGYVASVDVKQLFHNPYKKKIEANYTFPLSDSAAVDSMKMRIGNRTINGTIKRKEEAQQIYQEAASQGYVAALLDQERPNVFNQRVANVEPGKDIEVTIHYVDQLPYESGFYTFAFPTVVGPRFHADSQETANVTGTASAYVNTAGTFVDPQARLSRVNPTTYKTVTGSDISMSIDIDAGLPVGQVFSPLHAISINPLSDSKAHIDLINKKERPNRDFVLSWMVAGNEIKSGYFTHRDSKSGYFSMAVMPPKRVTPKMAAPKEMIFVVDRSGSQSGPPLDKAKETMLYILDHMNEQDTFQIISFSDSTEQLFNKPRPATAGMRKEAAAYIKRMEANGGTMIGPAVQTVCNTPASEHRLRIVTFMTDGYVDNEMEVLSLVKKSRGNSRWFSFGTGDSVNRFLIDEMARMGGGEAEYVLLNSPAGVVGKKFYDRISSPVLTDIKVSFEGIQVEDMFPRVQSDVWAERPLYINARYTKPGRGVMKVEGYAGGKPYVRKFTLDLPDKNTQNSPIAQLWARSAVEELMSADWFGMQRGLNCNEKLVSIITELGLRYHIMTQFTSFVAVDSSFKTAGKEMVSVDVPADIPEGLDIEKAISSVESAVLSGNEPSIATGVLTPLSTTTVSTTTSSPVENFQATCSNFVSGISNAPRGGWAGMINWLVASSRDANLFGGEEVSMFPSLPSFANNQSKASYKSMSSSAGAPSIAFVAPAAQLAPSAPMPVASPSPSPAPKAYASSVVPYPTQQANSSFGGSASSMNAYSNPYAGSYASQSMANGCAPILQGATNGTIGPQGADATSIMGVNTAGTVRVNNLANLEVMLNIVANGLDLICFFVGLSAIIGGALGMRRGKPGAGKSIFFGVTWLAVWVMLTPILIPWTAWLIWAAFWKNVSRNSSRPVMEPIRSRTSSRS